MYAIRSYYADARSRLTERHRGYLASESSLTGNSAELLDSYNFV